MLCTETHTHTYQPWTAQTQTRRESHWENHDRHMQYIYSIYWKPNSARKQHERQWQHATQKKTSAVRRSAYAQKRRRISTLTIPCVKESERESREIIFHLWHGAVIHIVPLVSRSVFTCSKSYFMWFLSNAYILRSKNGNAKTANFLGKRGAQKFRNRIIILFSLFICYFFRW